MTLFIIILFVCSHISFILEMTKSTCAVILGLFYAFLPLSTAVPAPLIERRNMTSECQSAPQVFNETCWESLNMTDWLTGWTLPTCTSDKIDNCCRPTDNWSNCFVRVATGVDLFNCTQFNTGDCASTPTSLSDSLDPTIVPQVWYVVKNIFGKPTPQGYHSWMTCANTDRLLQPSMHSLRPGIRLSQPQLLTQA